MGKLVSIIVPIYNSEKFLTHCINSIINQTYKDIEIVLINDGSTDKSRLICEEFVKEDDRIVLVNQNNSGVSAARNKGIYLSKGEFIVFVDSDDVICENYIHRLIENNSSSETLTICKIKKFDGNLEIGECAQNGTEIIDRHHMIDIYDSQLLNSPCAKLYSRRIISKYNIEFMREISLGEDLLFNLEYISHISSIKLLNEYMYYYRTSDNGNNLSRKYTKNFMDITCLIYDTFEETFCDISDKDKLYRCLYNILDRAIQNEFNNRKNNIIKRIACARKLTSLESFTTRLEKCKDYIDKKNYFFLKKKCIILYKLLKKFNHSI